MALSAYKNVTSLYFSFSESRITGVISISSKLEITDITHTRLPYVFYIQESVNLEISIFLLFYIVSVAIFSNVSDSYFE